jgi:hypothetical protein
MYTPHVRRQLAMPRACRRVAHLAIHVAVRARALILTSVPQSRLKHLKPRASTSRTTPASSRSSTTTSATRSDRGRDPYDGSAAAAALSGRTFSRLRGNMGGHPRGALRPHNNSAVAEAL